MLQPSRILDFLGLHFNPERALISPPDSFLPTLTNVLSHLSPSTVMTARKVSSIISRMSHFAPFISSGRLHLRFLQFWFKAQWSQHQQSWDTPIQLDTDFLTYLRWFQRPTVMTGVPLHLPEPSLFFFTDASLFQLEGQSDFRTMVSSRISTSYKLAGTISHPTCATSVGSSVGTSICESLLRQQYRSSVHPQTGGNTFSVPILQNPGTVRSPGSVCDNSSTYAPPRSQERHGRCSVPNQSTQPNRMASSNRYLEQSVLCLRNSPDRHVCHSGEQGNAHLCFSLPGRQSMGGRRPVPIMGRFGTCLCSSSGSHCSPNSPENPKARGTTVIMIASQHPSRPWHPLLLQLSTRPRIPLQDVNLFQYVPNLSTSIQQRSQAIGSSREELIRDVLKRHHYPDTVVDMAANPLRDSSSNVYNSHWKAFALWANNKDILPSDFSYITLAEYLVYLFSRNKKVNTILVHKASISSVLKLLNPPTALQESTLHNVIRRMTILRAREQEVLPRWHLSVVLKGLMKPLFAINGTDRHISLEFLSYKTAFLVALASGARGSELVALSRASHNLEFTTLASGVKQVSIRMVPKFIPKNQQPEIILEPIKFPGIAHLFPNEPERLLCPVRALGLYIVKSADRAQDDSLEKIFVHFNPASQLFTTHFRRWVAETICLTYENSSESDLPTIKAHDVRGISASIAFYRNTPLKDLCGLIGWKSSNVRHYLRDMAADTEPQDIPLVAAWTAFP